MTGRSHLLARPLSPQSPALRSEHDPRPPTPLDPPPGWCPFGPPEAGLLAGPDLSVARLAGHRLRPLPPAAAREAPLRHALSRSAPIDAALAPVCAAIPLVTPFDTAIRAHARAHARALPGFACVRPADDTALFLRPPEAVLQLGAGRQVELEFARWITGAEALALLHDHRAAWGPGAGADVLTVHPAPPDGTTLRRALALGAAGLTAAPVLAAPVLLVGAVPWLIGTAALWSAAVALGPRLLRVWAERRPQPAIRLDPWRLSLPARLGPAVTDRAALWAMLSWRMGSGTANTGVSGRAPTVRMSPMTFLHLTGPDLDLTLARIGAPAQSARLAQAPADLPTGAFVLLPPAGFDTLAARLAPPRRA